MSLSSLSLTENSAVQPNGSFTVAAGTLPAHHESTLFTPLPPSQAGGRCSTSITGTTQKVNGLGRGAADGRKEKRRWKPPEYPKSAFQYQRRRKRGRVQRNSSAKGDYPGIAKSNKWKGVLYLEPSAAELAMEGQSRGRVRVQKEIESRDMTQNHHQLVKIYWYLTESSFKECEKERRRAPGSKKAPKVIAEYSPKLLLVSPVNTTKSPSDPSRISPANNNKRKAKGKPKSSTMERGNSQAPNRARDENRNTLAASRSRGERPFLSSNGGRGISMMLGKMLTENRVALAKAAGAARYAWGGYGEVNVQPTETQNLFIFTFNNEAIREKIWRDRPWSLSNTTTAIEKYNGRGKPEEVPIDKVAMWVQIHGIHQNQRNEENMVAIGNHYFPGMLDLDRASLAFTGYRKFLRILVEVDIEDPIPTGFDFPFTDETTGDEHCDIIEFKYERLVELCYFCGRIGHNWPTCWRMNEERKKNGVAYLSEVYNSSLKAGIDSPHRHQSTNNRSSREGEGSQSYSTGREKASSGGQSRWEGAEGKESTGPDGRISEGDFQIPPGFTVRRIEEPVQYEEDHGARGRWRGRYRDGMGATNLSLEMERAAAAMEAGLQLEEVRADRSFGRNPGMVETTLSLGPTQPTNPGQCPAQAGPIEVDDYQHTQDGREEELGRKQKKRKGMGLLCGLRPNSECREKEAAFDGPVGEFEMGGLGVGPRRKNMKFKAGKNNTSMGNQAESEQEGRGKNKAAVVRQKPPLQE
ncbi:unnamed protein product [Linum trigynum]|uniref:Zinc knuckle CX2CX4HX4C domain-containing protein n=1 Tax=Linum trigynum TaxID=586398 RepID=A0AAV2G0N3_9ROSI